MRAMTWRDFMAGGWRAAQVPALAPAEAQADLVELFKSARRLEIKRGGKVLKSYRVALGFAPDGHKERAGDGRTPEGRYTIDARNPNSAFHLSLRVSYPDDRDKARAAASGVSPGGDTSSMANPTDCANSQTDTRATTGPWAASPSPTPRSARSGRWSRPARPY